MLKEIKEKTEDPYYINGLTRLEEFINNINDDKELLTDYARRFVTVFFIYIRR